MDFQSLMILSAAAYILPVLAVHAVKALGKAHPRKVATYPADPIDHNFDSMWEVASRR